MALDPDLIQSIFLKLIEISDRAERDQILAEACRDDVELRQRLEALLDAHDRSGSFLGPEATNAAEEPRMDPAKTGRASTLTFQESAAPREMIAGRFKLLQQIGEGGMGTVWMAEQREPVKRLVALKVIKPGMDSRNVLVRFEAERQALALMDHPNIARVYDGGTTEQGRPYFVMELVKGVPITEYCDERQLPMAARLDLFVQVCAAVQHAHQKGIIHRDLKPSNILVTEHDGKPVPKVIDFGLAKALNAIQVLTDHTLHTAFGAVVGTPIYMAPEQVGINALDIDTRSDVYSLGVLLYELLTGSTPLEKKRFKEAAWEEIRRIIREEEPPRPSMRLSSSDALPAIAARRNSEPAKLSRFVRGELDWIVMRALEKDRGRRYETANGLSRDVQRFLANEPVEACPPSLSYRMRKFMRRNRGSVAAATVFLLAILLGIAGTTWGMFRAIEAESDTAFALETVTQEQDRTRKALDEVTNAQAATATALEAEKKAKNAETRARQDADRARIDAEKSEDLALRRFHAGQLNLASQALASNERTRALDFLESLRPLPGKADLRTFEWYYLWGEVNKGLRFTLNAPGIQVIASRDGKYLVNSGGGFVRIWDVATREEVVSKLATGYPTGTPSLALSPDGKRLAGGTWRGGFLVWEFPTGKPLIQQGGKGQVRWIGWRPDGKWLAQVRAGPGGNHVVFLDPVSFKVLYSLDDIKINDSVGASVAFSKDSKKMAIGAGSVKIYDTAQFPLKQVDEIPSDRTPNYLSWSPDGSLLLISGENGFRLWDFQKKQDVYFRKGNIGIMDVSEDWKTLIGLPRNREMAAFEIATGVRIANRPSVNPIVNAVNLADGGGWATISPSRGISVWNTFERHQPEPILLQEVDDYCGQFTLNSDADPFFKRFVKTRMPASKAIPGRLIANFPNDGLWVTYQKDGAKKTSHMHLIDAGTGALLDSKLLDDRGFSLPRIRSWCKQPILVTNMAAWFNPTRPLIAWEIKNRKLVQRRTFKTTGQILHAEISPDGRHLAIAHDQLEVVDFETGEVLLKAQVTAGFNRFTAVAFSPNGKWLAGGTNEGTVEVFEWPSGRRQAKFRAHSGWINSIAFLGGNRSLAISGSEGTITWGLDTQSERIRLPFMDQMVASSDRSKLYGVAGDAVVYRAARLPEALAPVQSPTKWLAFDQLPQLMDHVKEFQKAGRKEDAEKAVRAHAELLIQPLPSNAVAYRWRAECWTILGETELAQEDLRHAAGLDTAPQPPPDERDMALYRRKRLPAFPYSLKSNHTLDFREVHGIDAKSLQAWLDDLPNTLRPIQITYEHGTMGTKFNAIAIDQGRPLRTFAATELEAPKQWDPWAQELGGLGWSRATICVFSKAKEPWDKIHGHAVWVKDGVPRDEYWQEIKNLDAQMAAARTKRMRPVGFLMANFPNLSFLVEPNDGRGWEIHHSLTLEKLQELIDSARKRGWRPDSMLMDQNVANRFAVILIENTAKEPWEFLADMDAKIYERTLAELRTKGFRPQSVVSHLLPAGSRYAGIWIGDLKIAANTKK